MQSNPSVLAIGELLWDLLPSGKLLGGAPANCCFRLAQLGVDARMVSRIGTDALGGELAADLTARGFDLSLVQRDAAHPTGTVEVQLSPEGSPCFTIIPAVAYDHLEATPELLAAARQSHAVCFGTLIQRSPAARQAVYAVLDAASSAIRFLDINLRQDCYSAQTVAASLERATILKLNSEEVVEVSRLLGISARSERDAVGAFLRTFPLKLVLVTRGAHGAYALSATGEEALLPGIEVLVVDTIGSGDSFSAGFLSMHIAGASLRESCHFGNINGALNASRKGGMPIISAAELEAFMAQHPMP